MNYQFLLVVGSTLCSIVVTRKEKMPLKILIGSLVFSINYLYNQLVYEHQLFYKTGLNDTRIGQIIRNEFKKSIPDDYYTIKLIEQEINIETFNNKFRVRNNPLERFQSYAKKFNQTI